MRRAFFAEGLGSMLLATAVIGSGIMAQRLTGDGAVALLANTLATTATLAVLISTLAPISGAHFNPVVSLIHSIQGSLSPRAATTYMAAQAIGCCAGAVLAHAMFELPLVQISTHTRTGFGQLLAEALATAGLVAVVLSCPTPKEAAWRVPAWIGGAYWFTASTSFANPAITLGRAWSDTFSGIAPENTLGFVAAQLIGALAGLSVGRALGISAPR